MAAALKWAGFILGIVGSTGAAAQLFKCKGPDGKTVYSDTRCEAAASGSALKVVPNSSTEHPLAAKPKGAAEITGQSPKAGAPDKPAAQAEAPAPPVSRELSSADRERLRSLDMTVGSVGATSEQKEAAHLEIGSIRSGRDQGLSRDDRELRDSLTVDLGSVDRKKRADAMRQLRQIYYR
jgi:hypothetical protein